MGGLRQEIIKEEAQEVRFACVLNQYSFCLLVNIYGDLLCVLHYARLRGKCTRGLQH